MAIQGTWVEGIEDVIIEQLFVVDSSGIDLEDINAVRRYSARNGLNKLLALMSQSKTRYHHAKLKFKLELDPHWLDEEARA